MLKIEVPFRRFAVWTIVMALWICLSQFGHADSSTANLLVSVSDSSGAVIPRAHLVLRNSDTNQEQQTDSGSAGSATFSFLKPGHYILIVSKDAFADIVVDHILLNVGDEKHLQLSLKVGSAAQTVTVDGSGLTINTTDASVSTVVDRKFVENMPLNGRSFQDLISMTPGVVTQSSQAGGFVQNQGDFSVNGQRTESNYYTVDGVSGNIGAGYPNGSAQNGTSGSISASTALGTTQSLVSVDALQEFRVSSSTYSAEYGRTPGGQFSLSTRSGTDLLHGTVFDYLRNDVFDANDWFNNHNGVRKTPLRQNDFGGTIGGPLILPYRGRERSFFFVSYEGLRLVQPVAATTQYVPSLAVRSSAPAAMQPILNAFPVPTGSELTTSAGSLSGLSPFIKGYSLPAKINTTSVRVDHKVSERLSGFVRYSYSPTNTSSRTLSSIFQLAQNSQTYTAGIDSLLWRNLSNSLRLGFSASQSSSTGNLDSFGGAVPVDLQAAFGVPGSYDSYQYYPFIFISGIGSSYINQYKASDNFRQWNVTDVFALSLGKHQLRFGVDERHFVSPLNPTATAVLPYYYSRAAMVNNSATTVYAYKDDPARPVFNEFSAFIQDEWRVQRSLSLSYGLRWEVNPPPGAADGRPAYTAYGNPQVPTSLTLAPRGAPLWKTAWYNLAPRLGMAWTAHNQTGHETVLRVGGGVFYDTGNQSAAMGFSGLGFRAIASQSNVGMQLPASLFNFSTAVTPPYTAGVVYIFPQHLQLPYTLQWNVSADQALGSSQTLTLSYVGSSGRRLLQRQNSSVTSLNPNFGTVTYYPSGVTSNYQALQFKYQRSVAKGLQSLISYTWAHSLDYGSTNASYPLTYGNSDFDVRHNLQGGVSWTIPHPNQNWFANASLNGWGLDGRINVRSAFPITLTGNTLVDSTGAQYYSGVNYNPSNPIYLFGSQYPGGRAINGGPRVSAATAAFTLPTGTAAGNASRNFVRAFGATQINVAARREFHIVDNFSLQFRAEAFNILNHPNFGYIDPTLIDAQFGQVTKMLNSSLGSMSSLYQQGGSRSMQFSLKLAF